MSSHDKVVVLLELLTKLFGNQAFQSDLMRAIILSGCVEENRLEVPVELLKSPETYGDGLEKLRLDIAALTQFSANFGEPERQSYEPEEVPDGYRQNLEDAVYVHANMGLVGSYEFKKASDFRKALMLLTGSLKLLANPESEAVFNEIREYLSDSEPFVYWAFFILYKMHPYLNKNWPPFDITEWKNVIDENTEQLLKTLDLIESTAAAEA